METWKVQANIQNKLLDIATQKETQMYGNFLEEKHTAKANAYCMRSDHNNKKKKILCKQKNDVFL